MRGTSNSACVLHAVLAAVSGAFLAVAALYAASILGADSEQHTEASGAKRAAGSLADSLLAEPLAVRLGTAVAIRLGVAVFTVAIAAGRQRDRGYGLAWWQARCAKQTSPTTRSAGLAAPTCSSASAPDPSVPWRPACSPTPPACPTCSPPARPARRHRRLERPAASHQLLCRRPQHGSANSCGVIPMRTCCQLPPVGGSPEYVRREHGAGHKKFGVRLVFFGKCDSPLIPSGEQSDAVTLVQYPSRRAFGQMVRDRSTWRTCTFAARLCWTRSCSRPRR